MNFNKDIYELLDKHELKDISSEGYVLRHKKSGARLALISNEDENKVFTIGFRTPPTDSTGVPHILEHSVLCGSDKYPAKDPFVELVKGSLNTFLNAMTFPDKTIYPIASCNDVDFKNLTDVYMDAVFHPNIYKREEIFKQEGWHYELESLDAPLTYNGVVYNEMKGAFSSANTRLNRECLNSLYPDTAYATESGGDPEYIPNLTYEQFLNFHKSLYHPSNCYIYVYGNCDMEERLEYFDREYLSKYDAIKVDSELAVQPAFEKSVRKECSYSVTEEEGTENKTYLAFNASVGKNDDDVLALAFSVLEYALLTAPGAPVKQALIDAGIGEDVDGGYNRSVKQPIMSVIASNTNEDREEEFIQIIMDTLKKVVKEGINKKTLKAGINNIEFSYKEADFGRYPKGLMYGITAFDSWLHDDLHPFVHVESGKAFEFLKAHLDTDYFEKLVEEYLIHNKHTSVVVLKPEIGLSAKKDLKTAEKLEEYKKTLTKEQLETLIEDTKALKKYQDEPSTKEELETIPLLTREDISKEVTPFVNDVKKLAGIETIHHKVNTNGIGYLKLSFDMNKLPDALLPFAGLLTKVMGYMGTEKYTFSELSNEIDINTGGIGVSADSVALIGKDGKYRACMNVVGKSLTDDFAFMTETMEEIINHTVFDDYKRLKEILGEVRMSMQSGMEASGHVTGIKECLSQMSELGALRRMVSGIGFYRFIDDAYKNFDSKKEEIVSQLKAAAKYIFTQENLIISFTDNEKGYQAMEGQLEKLIQLLSAEKHPVVVRALEYKKTKLALKTGGQVDYVVRCGDYTKHGLEYNGALRILGTIMSYDYLWLNIRVKGGAYGCMSNFGSFGTGSSYFASYRDPNLTETNEIFNKVPDYVKNFQADEREMTKYIIGTISDMDIPMNPSAKGGRSFDAHVRGLTVDMIKKERTEILTADAGSIRAMADKMEAILEDGYFCVVGSEEKINAHKELFDQIENLI